MIKKWKKTRWSVGRSNLFLEVTTSPLSPKLKVEACARLAKEKVLGDMRFNFEFGGEGAEVVISRNKWLLHYYLVACLRIKSDNESDSRDPTALTTTAVGIVMIKTWCEKWWRRQQQQIPPWHTTSLMTPKRLCFDSIVTSAFDKSLGAEGKYLDVVA